jgi:hypothetical protein
MKILPETAMGVLPSMPSVDVYKTRWLRGIGVLRQRFITQKWREPCETGLRECAVFIPKCPLRL